MLDKGSLSEKVPLKQNLEGNEGVRDVAVWEENMQGSRNSQCKGPEVGPWWFLL